MKFERTDLIRLDEPTAVDKTTPVSPVSVSGRLSSTKMSPAKDSYWFAHAAEPREIFRPLTKIPSSEKDDSSATQDHTSPSHKSAEKSTDLHLEGVSPVEKLQVPPRATTPNRLDSYWFAHGGGNDLSSPLGDHASDSGFSEGKDSSPSTLQRERKDDLSKRREREKDLNGYEALRSPQKSKLHINNLDRSQNIDYVNQKKQMIEERKGYIWDTERDRKDGILKQSFEQEAKLEARRNAQKNSLSFAFGSSGIDNNIAFSDGHHPYHGSEILFPIIRHIDDKDVIGSKTQDTSSYNLIQKIVDTSISPVASSEYPQYENRQRKRNCLSFASNQTRACLTWSDYVPLLTTTKENDNDCMSRSMIINSTSVRGRRKTDLVPAVPWSRATVPRTTSPGNQGKRSVSMSRLDQLAQPRRHYVEARQEIGKNASSSGSQSFSPSMSKSMYNVNSHRLANRKLNCANMSAMSKSMLHLANPTPIASNVSCASVNVQSCLPAHSSLANSKRLSQSMMHLSVAPRPTRASRLRAEALAAAREKGFSSSMLLLNKNDAFGSKLSLAPAMRKEVSHSPARPRSSLSTATEPSMQTQQPKVTMRQKTTKLKPRPISIAGTIPDHSLKSSVTVPKEQQRPSRPIEKKASGSAAKPSVAKVTSKPPVAQKPSPTSATIVEKKDNDSKSDRSISPQPVSLPPQPKTVEQTVEPVRKSPSPPNIPESNEEEITTSNKPRITSEEEAKAALQEKRRLAREQAEREAELERQRQEELRRLEEEKRRKEEEEQKRLEEEQLRLMEELRRQEEEKLKKAIEERERREQEEQKKREEEEKLKAEREEQERKAREEAERQHKELEERLKREEAERAERKRRVEQIMSRTRGKAGQQQLEPLEKPVGNNTLTETTLKLAASGQIPSSVLLAISSIQDKQKDDAPNNNVLSEKLSDNKKESSVEKEQTVVDSKSVEVNGKKSTVTTESTLPVENFNKVTPDSKQSSFIMIDNDKASDKIDSCDTSECKVNAADIQTNGYNSNEEKEVECVKSLERLESSTQDLRKISQSSSGEEITDSSLDQVINLEATTNATEAINQNEVNLLNNADDINSNRVPGNPLIAFEDIRQKETSVTG
ncbi:inner centromere protein A-like isoform X2 [Centruroides vittatus]|uniref:inner centromere protein A-like isoform X2 n=1 Tax=Centruroides vittatus TaxID=120091 RepID=UPI00350F6434